MDVVELVGGRELVMMTWQSRLVDGGMVGYSHCSLTLLCGGKREADALLQKATFIMHFCA